MSIYSIIQNHEALLALEPEELAGVVIEYFNTLEEGHPDLNKHNFGMPHAVREYPPDHQNKISMALMEAWSWLEREGLIAQKPGSDQGFVFVTRRGQRLKKSSDLKAYRHANMLPKNILHPIIAQKVWSLFMRGEYDTAVFQAFKDVEVAVRKASNSAPTDLGVDLMRKAFSPKGCLSNSNTPIPEQEALSHLFAGAIGSYKNPHSHRHVPIEPREAVEMIILASHLLYIVDSVDTQKTF